MNVNVCETCQQVKKIPNERRMKKKTNITNDFKWMFYVVMPQERLASNGG